MANIHEVLVRGVVPFHLMAPTGGNADMIQFVGHFNMPGYGLSLKWTEPIEMIPNSNGGRTAMYGFELSGEEAVWPSYIEKFIKTVLSLEGGKIEIAKIRDVENNSDWWTIPNPTVAAAPPVLIAPGDVPF